MNGRRDEKAKRREERLAAEEAEKRAQARRQRLLIGGGVLGVAAVLAAIVVLVTSGGGANGSDGPTETPNTSVPIPSRQITDLEQAAEKAGCEFTQFPEEGHVHIEATATNDAYKTNPPTSGDHRPPPAAEDGIYATGNEPDKENWVHTLEHGRIVYQYAPGTPQRRIDQLQTLFAEPFGGSSGYHQAVMQNNTDMPFAVAAVAWTRYVGCEKFTDDTFDVFRAFRERFVDKGREFVP